MVVASLAPSVKTLPRAIARSPQALSSRGLTPRYVISTPYTISKPSNRKLTSHLVRAGKIIEVNENELEVEVGNRDRPLVIDFFATWCGPCVLMAKELEQVAEELGDAVKIIKIDCDKNEAISNALQIQGLPTLIFVGMDQTKPALRTEGLLPAGAIIDIIQKELMTPAN